MEFCVSRDNGVSGELDPINLRYGSDVSSCIIALKL